MRKLPVIILLFLFLIMNIEGEESSPRSGNPHICAKEQVEKLLKTAPCMEGFVSNQSGPLGRLDSSGNITNVVSFTVEQMKIPSDGISINGWLYLPLGNGKHPLIVLTNGGGDGTRAIKSLSEWIAPILAHCGVAAFVHDKRGTGESGGVFIKTSNDDYAVDAGNCAQFLSTHPRIDSSRIGVLGGSEGGRVAVLAASRFPIIKFVVSFAGTVVGAVDDRINAQKGWLTSLNLPDSAFNEALDLHSRSIRAWASGNREEHEKVNKEIVSLRKKYDASILPFTKEEMDTIPAFAVVLPTWYSLSRDYMSELKTFRKKWLAIFGQEDRVVPTEASVNNIIKYMEQSGNNDYKIVVIPSIGHTPVNNQTKRMVRLDNIILNWLAENGFN